MAGPSVSRLVLSGEDAGIFTLLRLVTPCVVIETHGRDLLLLLWRSSAVAIRAAREVVVVSSRVARIVVVVVVAASVIVSPS